MLVTLRVAVSGKSKYEEPLVNSNLGSFAGSESLAAVIFEMVESLPRRIEIKNTPEAIGEGIEHLMRSALENADSKGKFTGESLKGAFHVNILLKSKGKKKQAAWAVKPEVEVCH